MINHALCDDVELGGGADKSANLSAIKSVLFHNYGVLLAALAFIVGTAVVVVVVAYMIQQTVSNYYKYMVRRNDGRTALATSIGRASGPGKHMDDEVYGTTNADQEYMQEQKRDEYSSIRSRIARLKAIYRGYNRAMTSHSMNVLDRRPDDLIDERILNPEQDDYVYNST